jgi:carbonic anhydrase
MTRIIQGVVDFQKKVFGPMQGLFEDLQGGQQPLALFITCSDSRIDPNLLTQTEPGQLFVLRNAGNLVPPFGSATSGEAATIEYAVRHLRVRDIILCGHSQCGAMQGLLAPGAVAEMQGVSEWLRIAEPALDRAKAGAPDAAPEQLLTAVIEQNVLLQIEHLQTYPEVREAATAGKLRMHAWLYQFENGEVLAYDASQQRFVPLSSAPRDKLLIPMSETDDA